MINLVKYIFENFSYGIFAAASVQTLRLAQTEKFSLYENVLRIDFHEDKFEFNYIDQKRKNLQDGKKFVSQMTLLELSRMS